MYFWSRFSFLWKHGISVGRLVGALGLKSNNWKKWIQKTNKQTSQIARLARPREEVIQIQTFSGSWLQLVRHELQYSDGCHVSAKCKSPEIARSSFQLYDPFTTSPGIKIITWEVFNLVLRKVLIINVVHIYYGKYYPRGYHSNATTILACFIWSYFHNFVFSLSPSYHVIILPC